MAQIEIVGNLGGDAEIKFVPSGDAVLNFSVADTFSRKNKTTNEWEEVSTTWWRVAFWGKQAETYAEHLKKGTRVTVSGVVHSREWTTDAGEKRLSFDVKARTVGIIPRLNQAGSVARSTPTADDPWSAGATNSNDEPPF